MLCHSFKWYNMCVNSFCSVNIVNTGWLDWHLDFAAAVTKHQNVFRKEWLSFYLLLLWYLSISIFTWKAMTAGIFNLLAPFYLLCNPLLSKQATDDFQCLLNGITNKHTLRVLTTLCSSCCIWKNFGSSYCSVGRMQLSLPLINSICGTWDNFTDMV